MEFEDEWGADSVKTILDNVKKQKVRSATERCLCRGGGRKDQLRCFHYTYSHGRLYPASNFLQLVIICPQFCHRLPTAWQQTSRH